MVDEKVSHLLEVLKDVNRDEVVIKLNQIKENNDNHISHLFLEDYFKNKDEYISPDVYRYEAQSIVNIFPQYSVEYIQSMLETLGSESNRVIIILRQLLKNEPIKYRFRLNDINHTNIQTRPVDVFSHASNRLNDVLDYKTTGTLPTIVTNKREDSPLKRKSIANSDPPIPKIKIKIAKCSTNLIEKYNVVPETCTSYSDISNTLALDDFPQPCKLEPFPKIPSNTEDLPTPHSNLQEFSKTSILEDFPQLHSKLEEFPKLHSKLDEFSKPPCNLEDFPKLLSISEDFPKHIPKSINNVENLPKSPPNLDQFYGSNMQDDDLIFSFIDEELLQSKESTNTSVSTNNTYKAEQIDFAGNVSSTSKYNPPVFVAPATTNTAIENRQGKILNHPINLVRKMDDDVLQISSEDDTEYDSYLSDLESEAGADFVPEANSSYDSKLVSKMMEMFPDASPAYVKQLCIGKTASPTDIEIILQIILSNPNYPKRQDREPSPDPDLDLEEQVTLLTDILPDADPNYLQYHAELYLHEKEKLKEFMSNALESKNYPTRKEYLRKQQLSAQVNQYTTEFKIEKFLELIPDPDTYFNDPNKKSSLLEGDKIDVFSSHYAKGYLKNHYPMISVKTIHTIMDKHKDRLIATVKELDQLVASKSGLMKTKRKPLPLDNSTLQNIPLLQEIAYLDHRSEIKRYLEEKETKEKEEREQAKQNGWLRTCNCCYNDEVMPKNIVSCENGCDFCNECVKTSAEILFGEGKLDFPCLQDCGSAFSLQTLKNVLSPKMFSKMAQRKQLEEVKAAGIEELEMCPFCDFATIPAPGDKLFRCLNPECMKESCRECKEPSHVPLRCDEIEKDDDVKRRTYIENKMTEALIRVCYKCGMKFIKADGCNKMTCSCGAMMCYVCGKPVTDYRHFNGQGGDKYHLCPLYSNTNELHRVQVTKGAEAAKAEMGIAEDPTKLKIDPTADLHQHYKKHNDKHPVVGILPHYGAAVSI
ncbi:ubiquitin conjugating enzyme 7 interacting protein-related [Holotrichia oblita]|uniref:Ubiquitin conjugating enzyme 7 interacting protein-related n=1 Tax=Holotrichia oblita TaxID=644536 RepID=A0ACB9TWX8_HOLOL|nr:ubiquitin conjugating enzyme 7 interacting protein-related [Holotrichia oblita]